MKRSDTVLRQPLTNRIAHGLIAVSTFALIASGMGQMPMAARYGLAALPGMGWTADYSITLAIHYIASGVLLFAIVLHVAHALMQRRFAILPRRGDVSESVKIIAAMLGRGEEPPSHKYLAEQRLAYAFIGVSLLVVSATGVIQTLKNLPGIQFDATLITLSTVLHNVAAVLVLLGVVGHFAAFILKENRALLPAMWGGRVDRAYAKHRHSLWYAEIEGSTAEEVTTADASPRPAA